MVGFKGKARGRLKTCFRFSDDLFICKNIVKILKSDFSMRIRKLCRERPIKEYAGYKHPFFQYEFTIKIQKVV